MITELTIRDLGVIGDATLEIAPGFTAVTGETGAGKTMVVTAIGLILGARADQGAVRSGAAAATVEGRFTLASGAPVAEIVDDAGGELDGAELIVSRRVGVDGRSRAFAGGRSVPAGVLTAIGHHLVAVHGQSDQVRLVSPAAQRDLLDRYLGAEVAALVENYASLYAQRTERQRRLSALVADRQGRAREAADLREALTDIAHVAPHADEDDELDQRIAVLSHSEDVRASVTEATAQLVADGTEPDGVDAIGLVEGARKAVERAASVDSSLLAVASSLAEARYALEDANGALTRYLDDFDSGGPAELEAAQQRRAALRDLVRKYGPTVADVIAYDARGVARLLELEADDHTIDALTAEAQAIEERLNAAASALTAARAAGAVRLGDAVTAELAALAMPGACVHVAVTELDDYTASGRDKVDVLLSAHPGAEPRPLSKGASGGELSRVMLAIEVVGAHDGDVPTYIFDEVDAGVGGAAAIEIGRRLARLAHHSQVIVVTHLAQVAAFADRQIQVRKDANGGYTSSSVAALGDAERTRELARMLSGLDESETGLAHAKELLAMARAADATK